jgi:peptidyl-dipeptidase Dcp
MKKIILTLIMIASTLIINAQANRNALLNDWSGPYGGVPAFTDYKLQDLKSLAVEALTLTV